MLQVLYPKRIVESHNVELKEKLLMKQPLQIDLNEYHVSLFHKDSYIILDFGKEMHGGIRILASASDLSPVRVRFGESVSECCAELGQGEEYSGRTCSRVVSEYDAKRNATNDHAMRDMYTVLPNWSDTPIGDTGFRFVRLDFAGEYIIKSIVCTNNILSKKAKYIYRGDKEIEKIFQTAKRTIDLCTSNGYIWDGIKRDRLVWAGDLAPEILALTTLYGKCKEIEVSLDLLRENTPLPNWMDNIPTYSLWWIITLKDYLDRTDSYDYVARQMDYLEALIVQALECVDDDGTLNYPGYFVDWPRAGYMEEREGFRAIAIMAAKAAIELLKRYNKNTHNANEYLKRLLQQEIHPSTKVVAALKYLATEDLSNDEQILLLSGGSRGMSTFMSYYILKAISAYDRSIALNTMKEYFGGMLSLGATSFWEEFDIEWTNYCSIDKLPEESEKCSHGDTGDHCYVGFRKSLCHGWAAGVIAFIKECEEE